MRMVVSNVCTSRKHRRKVDNLQASKPAADAMKAPFPEDSQCRRKDQPVQVEVLACTRCMCCHTTLPCQHPNASTLALSSDPDSHHLRDLHAYHKPQK